MVFQTDGAQGKASGGTDFNDHFFFVELLTVTHNSRFYFLFLFETLPFAWIQNTSWNNVILDSRPFVRQSGWVRAGCENLGYPWQWYNIPQQAKKKRDRKEYSLPSELSDFTVGESLLLKTVWKKTNLQIAVLYRRSFHLWGRGTVKKGGGGGWSERFPIQSTWI